MGINERKEREKAKKRKLLVDAAEKVFFEKGYENATMDEIAEKAEYSKGTLYLYFKNKEQLYIAISTRSIEIYKKIVDEEFAKAGTGRQKLAAIKNAYLRFFLEHPNHMKVMLTAMRSAGVIQNLHEDETALKELLKVDAEIQTLIRDSILQSAREGSLEGFENIDEKAALELVFSGGFLLNGLYQNIFDLTDYWSAHFPIEPEKLIRSAYKLLIF